MLRNRHPRNAATITAAVCALLTPYLQAQVSLHPPTAKPAAWERFALRVVNGTDTPTVAVRLVVPEAITVLGVEPIPDWTFALIPATDTSPQAIEWKGAVLERGEYREFAFLGRVAGDARQRDLVFPVRLTRANGSVVEWVRARGSPRPPPTVKIVGTTEISVWATFALAGAAVGIAALALVVAFAKGRREEKTAVRR